MNHEVIVGAIKKILKAKKISYLDLGVEIGMSESGVKKMLTGKDLSVSRLGQISEVIGLSLTDLFSLVHEETIKRVILTPKQEAALSKNALLLRVFWRLTIEDSSLDDIRQKERVDEKTLNMLLLKLENLDLIRRRKSGAVYPAQRGPYQWTGGGEFLKSLNREWSNSTLRKSLSNELGEKALHRLSYFRLSAKNQSELRSKLNEIVDEFGRRSQRDKLSCPARELGSASLLLSLVDSGFLDD